MAPPPGTLRVGRYFTVLILLIAALYSIVFFTGGKHTPKLGIDLVGGREVIFKAIAPAGKPPTTSQMQLAKQIIEDRVNGTGVTNATVVIQGNDQLIVDIPGGTGTDVSALGRAAKLNFRPVIAPVVTVSCIPKGSKASKTGSSATPSTTPSTSPSAPASTSVSSPAAKASAGASTGASPRDAGHVRIDAPGRNAPSTGSSTGSASGSATSSASSGRTAKASAPATTPPASSAPPAQPCQANTIESLTKISSLKIKSIPTTEGDYQKLTKSNPTAATAIQSALANFDCSSARNEQDISNSYYVACDKTNTAAYLLGKVIVPGDQIDTASAVAPNASGQSVQSGWSISLTLKNKGADAWATWTAAHNTGSSSANPDPQSCGGSGAGTFPCSDFVAFTLDGQVVSAPVTQSSINHQATQITGNFDEKSAPELADQLNYGALPLSFNLQSNNQISATLGTAQLKAGLLAGGIGLILVVLYSLIYYRGLGIVTIASLIVSAGLTYAMLVILGKQIGFNLDLSGIAGFIVAIGITADSFVVFFERIKDEVHEGRSIRVAVPRAWMRARRTVLSADFVSFLAAAILYYFAAGDVRGFAFTLGLSTILDLIVVFFFTHPIVSLLSRSRAFGSARFTGLNAVRAGGIAAPSAADEVAARPRRERPRRSATAVLDRDTDTRIETENDVDTDEATDTDTDADTGAPESRERSAPQTGTAAERAAARRARMREQNGEGDA